MKNDGGPAFPSQYTMSTSDSGVVSPAYPVFGLTVRDWFAAQVLPAVLSGGIEALRLNALSGPTAMTKQSVVQVAYEYADAMLAERAK